MRVAVLICVLAVVACGCRSRRGGDDKSLVFDPHQGVFVPASPAPSPPPKPKDEFLAQPVAEPTLRRGLVLSMAVLVGGEKEVDEETVMVDSEGVVSLPLLGKVEVAGKTLDETARLLKSRYDNFFVDPRILLRFNEEAGDETVSPWGFVTVLGRVKTPGPVKIPPTQDLTISQAIQKAGGLDKAARATRIKVTRRCAGGSTITKTVNLHSIGAEGKVADDIVLRSGDVVHVPEAIL